MTRVRKSPNMMSTTGRRPVIAAPSAMPVKPASEIGVSMTRRGPNSSTRPFSTLNGVPASATSSPRTMTAASRRISSASASLTAWPSVSSRTSGVDIFGHLGGVGERGGQRERDAAGDLGPHLLVQRLQLVGAQGAGGREAAGQQRDRVAIAAPGLLLVLRAVVRAVHVAHVVAEVAVRLAEQERGAAAGAGPGHGRRGGAVDRLDVLAVHLGGLDPEGAGPGGQVAGGGLRVVRVLVVEVVLADVDDGQAPQRGHVHRLVQQALAERAVAEEADGHLVGAAPAGGHRRSGGDAGAAADDRVGAQVAALLVGDVHGAALAPAVAGLPAQQLGEHAVHGRALGQAVAVAAVGAGDVVVVPERRADADRDRLLADV